MYIKMVFRHTDVIFSLLSQSYKLLHSVHEVGVDSNYMMFFIFFSKFIGDDIQTSLK